jgi:sugar phosphate isomerase/epimerase
MSAKLGFMASLGFGQMPAADVCRTLADLGYESVEWTLAHCDPGRHSVADLGGLVRTTEAHGLTFSEVVVQQDYVSLDAGEREQRVTFTLQCIDAFAEAGIGCVNLFTGPAPWNPNAPAVGRDVTEGAAWGMVFAAFDQIVPRAESAGIDLAVENVWGMLAHDVYTCRYLTDHYDSPRLGVNFDPSHDVLSGHLDVGWLVRQWGERIKHCHIKDAVGVPAMGKFLFPLIGEGLVDWPAFFEALDQIGFDGTCSVEFESFDYLRKVLDNDIVEAARLSMAALRKVRG